VTQLAPFFLEWPTEMNWHHKVDLVEANRRTLVRAGVLAAQIYDGRFCTMCNAELFHSFRRDPKDPGRMVSSIVRAR
jgi:copper oxidase (laccase) domain-containing protein